MRWEAFFEALSCCLCVGFGVGGFVALCIGAWTWLIICAAVCVINLALAHGMDWI